VRPRPQTEPSKEPDRPTDYVAVTDPSFRFRLERVRALRERKEDLAKQQLASALSRMSGSRERLQTLDVDLERARVEQRQATSVSGAVSAAELAARQAFVERVEGQRRAGAHELSQHEAEVANRGVELGNAARDHEMLERLKERHRTQHHREAERRESNNLDEIAIDGFRRSAA
jgi:flagellar FliJ protein